MMEEPIQSLDLVRGCLPNLGAIVGMWLHFWPGKTFAVHPRTWHDLIVHFDAADEAPPDTVVLDDRLDISEGHVVRPLPVDDDDHKDVTLRLVEP